MQINFYPRKTAHYNIIKIIIPLNEPLSNYKFIFNLIKASLLRHNLRNFATSTNN